MIDSSASCSIRWETSTSLPFTLPASAARASPGPIDFATSATVTGPAKLIKETARKAKSGLRGTGKLNKRLNEHCEPSHTRHEGRRQSHGLAQQWLERM